MRKTKPKNKKKMLQANINMSYNEKKNKDN